MSASDVGAKRRRTEFKEVVTKPKILNDGLMPHLEKTTNSVGDTAAKKMLLELLTDLNACISADSVLNSDFIPLDTIKSLVKRTEEAFEYIKRLGSTDEGRASVVLENIKPGLVYYQEHHPDALPRDPGPAIPPEWCFQRLRIEQERLSVNQNYKKLLQEINVLKYSKLIFKKVYICYSSNESSLVHAFMKNLYDILKLAGFDAQLYEKSMVAGGMPDDYFSQIKEKETVVLLFGSALLINGKNFDIERGFLQIKSGLHSPGEKKDDGKIIPILIGGHEKISFPEEIINPITNRPNWLNTEVSQFRNIADLFALICKDKDVSFTPIWNEFSDDPVNNKLIIPLDENQTQNYLKDEKIAEDDRIALKNSSAYALLGITKAAPGRTEPAISPAAPPISRMGLVSGTIEPVTRRSAAPPAYTSFPEEKPIFKKKNPIPDLDIPREVMVDFFSKINKITQAEVKKEMQTFMTLFQKKLVDYNETQTFNYELKVEFNQEDAISEIQNLIVNCRALIANSSANSTSKELAFEVFDKIITEYIDPYNKEYYPKSVVVKSSPDWHEHSLRLQQDSLVKNANFFSALAELKTHAYGGATIPKKVYICYSEPNLEETAYLSWVPLFIKNFFTILKTAGLNVLLYSESMPARDPLSYLQQIQEEGTSVLLFCTESLPNDKKYFPDERAFIHRKRELDRHRRAKIFPILISGNEISSVPAEMTNLKYCNLIDRESYFQNLCRLIADLYSINENYFKEIWMKFLNNKINQDSAIALSEGEVSLHLKRESIAKSVGIPSFGTVALTSPAAPPPPILAHPPGGPVFCVSEGISQFGTFARSPAAPAPSILAQPPGGPSFNVSRS